MAGRVFTLFEKEYIKDLSHRLREEIRFEACVSKCKPHSKSEERLLVLTQYRVLFLKSQKTEASIQRESHLFEIMEVNIDSNQLFLACTSFSIHLKFKSEEESLLFFTSLFKSYVMIVPDYARTCVFKGTVMGQDVTNEALIEAFPSKNQDSNTRYKTVFLASCAYYGVVPEFVVYRPPLRIFCITSCFVFCLKIRDLIDLEITDIREFMAFAKCSVWNHRFIQVIASGPFGSAVGNWADCIAKNYFLEKLVFVNSFATVDAVKSISLALNSSDICCLKHLDLGGNEVGDYGLLNLIDGLKKFSKPLTFLSIDGFNASRAVMLDFLQMLNKNSILSGLVTLNVSRNEFGTRTSNELKSWLISGKAQKLTQLYLNDCVDLSLTTLFPALLISSSDDEYSLKCKLEEIHASRGCINDDCGLQIAYSLFKSGGFRYIDLSYTQMQPSVAETIFASMARNPLISLAQLDLSGISFGTEIGVKLGSLLVNSSSINTLKLSDCKLGMQGVLAIFKGLTHTLIETLVLDKNIELEDIQAQNVLKPHHSHLLGHSDMALILKDFFSNSKLKYLSLEGFKSTKQMSNIFPIIESVSGNSLTFLNINGNSCGNDLAFYIKKILLNQKSLAEIQFDNNFISYPGLCQILAGFESNDKILRFSDMRGDIAVIVNKEPLQHSVLLDCIAKMKAITLENRSKKLVII